MAIVQLSCNLFLQLLRITSQYKSFFYHHSHIGDTLECAFENALHLLPDQNCIKEHLAKFTNFCTTCGNVWNSSKNTKQNSKKQMFQSVKLLFSVLRHLALFHEYHLKRFQIYSLCTRFHKYKNCRDIRGKKSSWWCYKNIRKWFYQWLVSMASSNNLSWIILSEAFEGSTEEAARSTRIETRVYTV